MYYISIKRWEQQGASVMSRDRERSSTTYFASAALPVRCGGCFAGGRALMTCVAVAVPDRNHRDRGCRIEFDRQHAEMGLGSLELNGGPRSTADGGLPTRTSVGVKRNLPPSRGTQILLFPCSIDRNVNVSLSLSSPTAPTCNRYVLDWQTSSGRCS